MIRIDEIPKPPGSDLFFVQGTRFFKTNTGCFIAVSKEQLYVNSPRLFWHLSIAHKHRDPTWEEIKQARYDLLPDDIYAGQILPPKKDYINIHDHCFHVNELLPG